MSGMFDAKPDKAQRKTERTLKEQKAKRKSKIITITVVVVFILVLTVSLIANSGWMHRTFTVVSIDGINFTTAEFEYFFNVQYMEYMQFMSQFQGMGGPDRSRPLSSQVYTIDEETGEPLTWADMFTDSAFARMRSLVGIYNAAIKDNFTLSGEDIEKIEYELTMIELEAEFSPEIPSANALLQYMYGSRMNMKVFRNILEFMITVDAYSEHVRLLPEYSDAQLSDYYSENADDLDVFNIRLISITADLPEEDTPDYDDAAALAVMEAQEFAIELASDIETTEDFIAAALYYNDSLYANPNSTLRQTQGENLNVLYSEWLLDSDRVYGDVLVANSDSGATIVFFDSRDTNDYYTVGMRQILILREVISPANYPEGEDDPDYIAAVENAQKDAYDRAQWVDGLFTSEGKTEAALLALMEEHSDETTEGGFYDGISRFSYQGSHIRSMKVVPELEDWLFEEGRRVGDSKLIETEAFGFHLMYFTGFGDKLFSHIIADDRIRTKEHTDWLENISETVGEPIKHRAFILVSV